MSIKNKPFVFLDGSADAHAQLFAEPIDIITTSRLSEVRGCLEKIDYYLSSDFHLAGFFAYECGHAFEEKLQHLHPQNLDTPLLWFGAFNAPQKLSYKESEKWLQEHGSGTCKTGPISPNLNQQNYEHLFARVQDYIKAGDIYQANLTFKGMFEFTGDPLSLYAQLRKAQHTAYGGYIDTGDETFLSLSPELFFDMSENQISCRPMKGTAPRSVTGDGDEAIKNWLKRDEKSQAENLMIVDLMRNDMARIAKPGSVRVDSLFHVETYPTLHQMTSEIHAKLDSDVSVSDIIEKLFPCGSITGAPKLRAMEILNELETAPRGIYTGTIGAFSPGGSAKFNVAIRTLRIKGNRGEIGIGSGLVADSDAKGEYDECLLKMRFLTKPRPEFDLLETLKWDPASGYILLDYHMERLEKSATYFGYKCDKADVLEKLTRLAEDFKDENMRVRLTNSPDGSVSLTHTPLPPQNPASIWRFVISDKKMRSDNPFLYHKTTHRDFYDEERERQKSIHPCDEVLFLNEKGEITEGSFTNIFLRIDGNLLTPARACGLLDGTYRRHLLEREHDPAVEAILKPEDLLQADQVYLGNSVRGLITAELTHDLETA